MGAAASEGNRKLLKVNQDPTACSYLKLPFRASIGLQVVLQDRFADVDEGWRATDAHLVVVEVHPEEDLVQKDPQCFQVANELRL